MIYSSYSELQGNLLQEGDEVIFRLETGGVLNYSVQNNGNGFVLFLRYEEDKYNNKLIFEKLNLERFEFCEQQYGYEVNLLNDFPEAKPNDFAALTRVTLALFDLIEASQRLAQTSEILFID